MRFFGPSPRTGRRPSYLRPELWAVLVALGGAGALVAGPRLAARTFRLGKQPSIALLTAAVGSAALAAAACTVMLARPTPTNHAYDATLWLLAGHVVFHVVLTLIMLGYLAMRRVTGHRLRIGEAHIVQLWADFTAATGLVALGAAWLPGALG